MEDHVRIRYENSMEDVLAFNRFHMSTQREVQRARILLTWALPLAILALAVVFDLIDGQFGRTPFAVIFGTVYVFLYRRSYARSMDRNVEKSYEKGGSDSVFCEHVLEVTPEGLVDRTPVSESRIVWSAIDRIETTETHTFIYTQAHAAHIVPREALSPDEYERLREAVRQAVQENAISAPAT